ncbi:hypothetical protein HMPREF1508_1823 [Shuttleworthella sp. MSX8B]|nr:hypothetical protein HMPREF1508_1823 [Shuttleworthia sp. MSX8B]
MSIKREYLGEKNISANVEERRSGNAGRQEHSGRQMERRSVMSA